MNRGIRIYAITLSVIVLALLAWGLYEDPRVSELNQRLEQEPTVAAFAYPFRVLRIESGSVAVMSTPRSVAVPVARVLGILFPKLAGRSSDTSDFRTAQQQLATVQTLARDRVLEDPQIKSVRWELDRDWLIQHGVQI